MIGTGDKDLYMREARDGNNTTSDPSDVPSYFDKLALRALFQQ